MTAVPSLILDVRPAMAASTTSGAETAKSFAKTEGAVNSELDTLREQLRSIDPTLADALETGRRKINYQLEGLRTRFYRAQMARDEAAQRQLQRAFDQRCHLMRCERFFQVVERIALDGLDSDVEGPMRGHHDDFRIRRVAFDKRKQVDPAQIEKVTLRTSAFLRHESGSEPAKWDPQTRETADHSLPYIFSRALQDGTVTINTFDIDKIRDLIGFEPERTLEEIILDVAGYQKKNAEMRPRSDAGVL